MFKLIIFIAGVLFSTALPAEEGASTQFETQTFRCYAFGFRPHPKGGYTHSYSRAEAFSEEDAADLAMAKCHKKARATGCRVHSCYDLGVQ